MGPVERRVRHPLSNVAFARVKKVAGYINGVAQSCFRYYYQYIDYTCAVIANLLSTE